MNRLQSELERLYLPRSRECADSNAPQSALVDPANSVRAMVIELAQPPSWEVLSRVWHGVQIELALPAPAIAVSGVDGLQLWFSLAEPIAVAQARSFLECLRSRFLPDIEPSRIRLMPATDATASHHGLPAGLVPAQQPTGNWSAFVAPGLAPVFADTPWIDVAPNEEGQAALLCGLKAMQATEFESAMKRLGPKAQPLHSTAATEVNAANAMTAMNKTTVDAPLAHPQPAGPMPREDSERFLLRVMNDDTVPLALRVDAAKALLQHATGRGPRLDD